MRAVTSVILGGAELSRLQPELRDYETRRAAQGTDIEGAAAALAIQGLAGWLATLDGNYSSRSLVTLAPVQMLGDGPALDWLAAITASEAARQRALRTL